MESKWYKRRKRLFEILEVGHDLDIVSRSYDFIGAFAVIVNVAVSIMCTYENLMERFGKTLLIVEGITIAFFALDFILRLFVAKVEYSEETEQKAIVKYLLSFDGIVDLMSFLPYYLPFFFPAGTAAFRMIRIIRVFRLFRINAYHDAISVIAAVIKGKKQQLISSVFIITILMIGSSLCMYSLEHEAQPEVFQNAFSGIWWATSTLLTVGYGDIYPITTMGKLFGIIISFLGVGMVAIPTGIISAGFVDQYTSIKKRAEYGYETDMHFIKIHLSEKDSWVGKSIAQLGLPAGVIISMIKRDDSFMIPRGDVVLQEDDTVVIGAEPYEEEEQINLKEIVIEKENPWNGVKIKDLDISRQSIIVLVKRKKKALIPNGNMILRAGDRVFLYTQMHLSDASFIEI